MKTFIHAIVLTFFALAVPSCACFQAAHRNDPQCAIIGQVVDCTEAAVMANTTQFKPLVQQLIAEATGAGGKIDWTIVEKGLGSIGVKDGGCILALIQNDYLTAAVSASPELLAARASYTEDFAAYRSKRWPGVKFKVQLADGQKVEL